MSWKKRFFRERTFVERDVQGVKMRFYPNRLRALSEIRDISKPVATAINTLLSGGDRDMSSVVEETNDEAEQFYNQKVSTEALSKEMAEYRNASRNDAIEVLIDTLCDQHNQVLLGRLWMDSLQDEFPYDKKRSSADVEEWLFGDDEDYNGLDLPIMVDICAGWLAANGKSFGDSGESLGRLLKQRVTALKQEDSSETKEPTSSTVSSKPTLMPSDSDSTPSS